MQISQIYTIIGAGARTGLPGRTRGGVRALAAAPGLSYSEKPPPPPPPMPGASEAIGGGGSAFEIGGGAAVELGLGLVKRSISGRSAWPTMARVTASCALPATSVEPTAVSTNPGTSSGWFSACDPCWIAKIMVPQPSSLDVRFRPSGPASKNVAQNSSAAELVPSLSRRAGAWLVAGALSLAARCAAANAQEAHHTTNR